MLNEPCQNLVSFLKLETNFVNHAPERGMIRLAGEAAVLATKSIVEQAMIAAFEALLPGGPTKGLVTAHSGPTWAAAKG